MGGIASFIAPAFSLATGGIGGGLFTSILGSVASSLISSAFAPSAPSAPSMPTPPAPPPVPAAPAPTPAPAAPVAEPTINPDQSIQAQQGMNNNLKRALANQQASVSALNAGGFTQTSSGKSLLGS